MLKKRVMIGLYLNDGVLFRTKKFVPDYRYTQAFLGTKAVDEVAIIDITRPGRGERENFWKAARAYADNCFSPITIGGNMKSLDEAKRIVYEIGGDKMLVNTAAHDPGFVESVVLKFGSQFLTVGIDARKIDGAYRCFSHQGRVQLAGTPHQRAREMERRGAGEILLSSIDRDGSLSGYDLDLLGQSILDLHIPVVITGGCGRWEHVGLAFQHGADGALLTNIYHFTDGAVEACKRWLVEHGCEVRM